MKKIILFAIAATTLFLNGCSDEDFNSKYTDPSKVTETQVPSLMTGVFQRAKEHSVFGYRRYFGFSIFMGRLSQTIGLSSGTSMYEPTFEAYTEGELGNFYITMMDYIKLCDDYGKLSPEAQKSYEAYKLGAMVHLYDWALSCVNMYGDIPFSKACQLPLTGNIVESYAKYDKAEDIYSQILDELKTAAERFISPDMSKHNKFNTQDFVCQGDLNAWAQYANSLRLRAAIRISQHGSLTAKGKAIIKEILENPTKYPIVDDNSKNIFLRNDHSDPLNLEGGGGLNSDGWSAVRASSGPLIDRMLSKGNYRKTANGYHQPGTGQYTPGADDPRILLLYTMRVGNTDLDHAQKFNYSNILKNEASIDSVFYIGIDPAISFEDPAFYDHLGSSEIIINGGFFAQNRNFEHVQMTAAETWFAKAEAYHRGWGVAQNETKAKEAFKEAVKQSIKLYYHWNEINSGNKTELIPTPTDDEIDSFSEARWTTSVNPNYPYNAADPKLDAILTQKWLHWGEFFPHEAWYQVRRTGIPKLIYPTSRGKIEWSPDRWLYPLSERSYNPNYPGLEKDTYYGKLFWADPRGMRHSTLSKGTWTDQYGD